MPLSDFTGCGNISKGVCSIKQGGAFNSGGSVTLLHQLCFAGKEKGWILSAEIKGSYFVSFAEFPVDVCIELSNPTSVRIKAR